MQVSDYNSCSPVVERVMAADVMRSCLVLVEDILEVLPVLLYQVCTVYPASTPLHPRPELSSAHILNSFEISVLSRDT